MGSQLDGAGLGAGADSVRGREYQGRGDGTRQKDSRFGLPNRYVAAGAVRWEALTKSRAPLAMVVARDLVLNQSIL